MGLDIRTVGLGYVRVRVLRNSAGNTRQRDELEAMLWSVQDEEVALPFHVDFLHSESRSY